LRIDAHRGLEVAVSELSADLQANVEALATALRARGWMLTTAESCTGGLISAACTSLAGSSDWFERGFVTYSNAAKSDLLGVPAALIAQHGAVSEEVARAMAEGALTRSKAQVSVSVTGVAGPGGGSVNKPVGTVWMAVGKLGSDTFVELLQLSGDRAAVRSQTLSCALHAVIKAASST
jgi:nicotinamide-nucleotide amidase